MNEPRIICFDIETTVDLREAHKVWPQLSSYYGQTLKAQVQSILCFGWKVFGEKESHVECAWELPEWEKDPNDDRRIVEYAAEILSGADAIVTQNGRKFDFPFLQTRLMKWEMEPLDPKIPHIDTKILARNIYLISNSLNNMGRFLLDEEKKKHDGWDLWDQVRFAEDPTEAREIMKEYCRQDVLLLEKLYRKFRPFARNIPNHNLFNPMREKSCPNCGSTRVKAHGWTYTKTARYHRYICKDCGRTSRSDVKDEILR